MSEACQEKFAHAVKTTERLGMELIPGTGPGWAGSGGPWIQPEDSMRHLGAGQMEVEGPARLERRLPLPAPLPANRFAGMTPEHKRLPRFTDGGCFHSSFELRHSSPVRVSPFDSGLAIG